MLICVEKCLGLLDEISWQLANAAGQGSDLSQAVFASLAVVAPMATACSQWISFGA